MLKKWNQTKTTNQKNPNTIGDSATFEYKINPSFLHVENQLDGKFDLNFSSVESKSRNNTTYSIKIENLIEIEWKFRMLLTLNIIKTYFN